VSGLISATWSEWWALLLAANAVMVWLLSLALLGGASTGPTTDAPEMTSLEVLARRWSRIRGTVYAGTAAMLPSGPRTARFIAAHRPRAEDLWRANRGAFGPARLLNQLSLLIGAAQLLLAVIVWVPQLDAPGWVFLAMSIFGVDLMFGIATVMSEHGRWRRRAPFEAQLVHASLAALRRPKKPLHWSEARSQLARIERVMVNRYARATDQPAARHHRDALWRRRVADWGAELAALDLQTRLPGGDFGAVVTDQVEAAVGATARTAKLRRQAQTVVTLDVGRLDPQARAGWILVALSGAVVVLFAALAATVFLQSTQTSLPSLGDVRAWVPAVGAMMTVTSIVVGAIAWGVRKLSTR